MKTHSYLQQAKPSMKLQKIYFVKQQQKKCLELMTNPRNVLPPLQLHSFMSDKKCSCRLVLNIPAARLAATDVTLPPLHFLST